MEPINRYCYRLIFLATLINVTTAFRIVADEDYFLNNMIDPALNFSGNYPLFINHQQQKQATATTATACPAYQLIPNQNQQCPVVIPSQLSSTPRQRRRSLFLDNLFANYDKRLFPSKNESVFVETSIYINSLDSVSEVSFDYELGIFLRLTWPDQRLVFDPLQVDGEDRCDLAALLHDKLWLPDIYIANEKRASFHMVTTPNRLIQLDKSGLVFYSRRICATLHCEMNLQTFPFDSQLCQMTLESFAYTEKHITLEWAEMPLETTPDLAVPQFQITGINFDKYVRVTPRGNVSSLIVTFTFTRDVGFYILQIYVPTLLIVLTAFTAFWIDPLAVPARVTLGVMPTLIQANMLFSLRKQLPLVSYVKAVDVWIIACMLFVFLALLEYGFVNVLLRQKPKGRLVFAAFGSALPGRMNPAMRSSVASQHTERQSRSGSSGYVYSPNNVVLSESCENINSDEIFLKSAANHRKLANFFFQGTMPQHPTDDGDADDDQEPQSQRRCGKYCIPFSRLSGIQRVEVIEKVCRYAFPGSFGLFTFLYWTIYCNVLQRDDDGHSFFSEASMDDLLADEMMMHHQRG